MVDGVKIYGEGETEVRALRGVSLQIERGQFTAMMGPSGSGKSTLLHTLAGLDTLEGGEVFIGGTALSTLKDRELTLLRREKVGFVFQTFNLIPTLDAEENILLPLSIAREGVERDWFNQIVQTLGLDDRLTHLPTQLSGGQQQRVAVARALISRPIIVCANEPTGNLDSRASDELLGFIREAVDEGADLDETQQTCAGYGGRLSADPDPDQERVGCRLREPDRSTGGGFQWASGPGHRHRHSGDHEHAGAIHNRTDPRDRNYCGP